MNLSEYSLYFKVFFMLFVLGIYGTGPNSALLVLQA